MRAKQKKAKKTKPAKKLKKAKIHLSASRKKRVAAAANRTAKKKTSRKKTVAKKSPPRRIRGRAGNAELVSFEPRGLGAVSGGQSGDTQGLSGVAETDSESVEELLEEGQSFEAEVVQGIESVPDADEGEIRTKQVAEDDVPDEYLEQDSRQDRS